MQLGRNFGDSIMIGRGNRMNEWKGGLVRRRGQDRGREGGGLNLIWISTEAWHPSSSRLPLQTRLYSTLQERNRIAFQIHTHTFFIKALHIGTARAYQNPTIL